MEEIAVDQLHLDPSNARQHSDRNLEAIRGSLARFGQQRSILVDHRGVVVAGNATLQAARDLGWETIRAERTDLDGVDRAAYAIADNRTGDPDLGSLWDQRALGSLLAEIQDSEIALDEIGFTEDEAAGFMDGDGSAEAEPGGGDEAPDDFPDADEATNRECPQCGYRWSE